MFISSDPGDLIDSLGTKAPKGRNMKGRREQSNSNLTEFSWSVLHVSIFGLGSGSSLLKDLSLPNGLQKANSGTSVS